MGREQLKLSTREYKLESGNMNRERDDGEGRNGAVTGLVGWRRVKGSCSQGLKCLILVAEQFQGVTSRNE